MESRLNSLRSTSKVTEEVFDDLEPEHVGTEGRRRSRVSTSVLGVMLILLGIVGAVATTRAATQSVAVLAVAQSMARGDLVTEDSLQVIDVPRSAARFFVRRENARDVIGTMTVGPIGAGDPLSRALLVRQPALDASMILVAVPIDQGNFPPTLAPGDNVNVIVSPDATIVDAAPPRVVSEKLRVWDIQVPSDGNGTTVVTLIADAEVALAVAGAGTVHLGLVQDLGGE